MRDQFCRNCFFYRSYGDFGECQRFPPQVIPVGANSHASHSPKATDWCGEWKALPPEFDDVTDLKPDYIGGFRECQAKALQILNVAALAEVDFSRRALLDEAYKKIDALQPGEK